MEAVPSVGLLFRDYALRILNSPTARNPKRGQMHDLSFYALSTVISRSID